MKSARPRFLPSVRPRKDHSRATILSDLIGDMLVRFGWVKPTLTPHARMVREAAERRAKLQAQLSAMHKHDSRRGEVERELRRQTFVVLSGGSVHA